MKLIEAINLGMNCGLETINEAVLNVDIHSGSLFIYDDIPKELGELYRQLHEYITLGGMINDKCEEAIKIAGGLE